MFSDLFELDAS